MTAMDTTEASRHKCLIYDGHASEQLPVIIPMMEDALQRNERCLYLGDEQTIAMISAALSHQGIDVEREMSRGALIFSSERETGRFDPKAMIAMLTSMIDEALRDGFTGLCATGDMRWELGGDEAFEHLLEYEAMLEQVFKTRPLRGVCQYHRSTVPPSALQDALRAHRSLYIGNTHNADNLFYVPPEMLLEDREKEQIGAWMYQQLSRVMDAERSRDKAIDALKETNKTLEQRILARTAALEDANKELEAFSYSVSHDLRAPVRHIKGFAGILEEDFANSLGEEGLTWVAKVRESANHMNGLIEGMLMLSRVTRAELHLRPVNLTAIAELTAQTLRANDPKRNVEWRIDRDLVVRGDTALLQAAIDNLLSNAWKFTQKREHSVIELHGGDVKDGFRLFRITDNGAGFDNAAARKLFGVFQRLHRQEDFPGTGVGLATVDRIIRRHGGRIWAEGAVDGGATFFFTLPVAG